MKNEPTTVQEVFSTQSPAIKRQSQGVLAASRKLSVNPQAEPRRKTLGQQIASFILQRVEMLEARDRARRNVEENRIDRRYLDNLMFKHNRSSYLQKDIKGVFEPRYADADQDFQREFIRECYHKNDALPVSSIVIQALWRSDLYALMNTGLTVE